LAAAFSACVWWRVRIQIFHGRQFSAQRPAGGRAPARAARGARAGCADARGVDRDPAADGSARSERGAGRANILQKFGSLNALALATVDELKQIAGVGPDKAATLVAAFALARRMEQERLAEAPVLDNPATVVNFMRETNRLENVESCEAFVVKVRKKFIRAGKN
jgi:hypothetical protein